MKGGTAEKTADSLATGIERKELTSGYWSARDRSCFAEAATSGSLCDVIPFSMSLIPHMRKSSGCCRCFKDAVNSSCRSFMVKWSSLPRACKERSLSEARRKHKRIGRRWMGDGVVRTTCSRVHKWEGRGSESRAETEKWGGETEGC